jgi:hypothetical protein
MEQYKISPGDVARMSDDLTRTHSSKSLLWGRRGPSSRLYALPIGTEGCHNESDKQPTGRGEE